MMCACASPLQNHNYVSLLLEVNKDKHRGRIDCRVSTASDALVGSAAHSMQEQESASVVPVKPEVFGQTCCSFMPSLEGTIVQNSSVFHCSNSTCIIYSFCLFSRKFNHICEQTRFKN